mgnify:CR=1 FL=1|tara:strand:+ start:85 stop:318 length:234 start_codon:yes stop_codon:yes gene_type:complete
MCVAHQVIKKRKQVLGSGSKLVGSGKASARAIKPNSGAPFGILQLSRKNRQSTKKRSTNARRTSSGKTSSNDLNLKL